MNIIINGKKQTIDNDSIKLLELIKKNDVQEPDMVSVQINGQFLNREDFENTIIKENDEIDFLYFMGGGKE